MEIEKYCKTVLSGEFQDEDDPKGASQEFGRIILTSFQQPSDSLVELTQQALLKAINFPEHKQSPFGIGSEPVSLALARAQIVDSEKELPGLLCLILRIYTFDITSRKEIRNLLGYCLSLKNSSVTLLRIVLEAIRVILDLTPRSTENVEYVRNLLTKKLLPLHSIQGKISPTQSFLGAFHKELTLCMCKACEVIGLSEAWEVSICELAGSRYPQISEGNSPKEVLFLHELESLCLEAFKNNGLTGKARSSLTARLLSSITSLQYAVCERALCFWQSDITFQAIQGTDHLLSKTCEKTLAKTSLEHWSPTCRSMAGAALLKSTGQVAQGDDAILVKAVEMAKEHAKAILNPPQQTQLPLPKTFTSTSVIRDATEPFAVGAFGVMWKGRAIVAGASRQQWPLICLKELDDPQAAKKEIYAMTNIGSHPNLVNLLGVFDLRRGETLSLVLDLVDGPGDLHTVVIERGALSLPLTKFLSGEVGAGLKFIHSKGFVFGDMKPENVLITPNGHAKICDFGSAFSQKESSSVVAVGTVEYMPPEQASSFQGDWWAFGCVVHFMLTGRPPVFFEREDESDFSVAFSRAVTFADQKGGVFIKDTVGRQLVGLLCSRNPSERPKDGGESHNFFTGYQPWETLYNRTDIPQIPKEKILKSEKNTGPWQRRTFSTIHSPLPGVYSIDSGFISSCVGGLSQFKDSPKIDGWEDTSKASTLFESSLALIPKTRIPSTSSTGRDNSKGGGKTRKIQANYTVAGVDLSAG